MQPQNPTPQEPEPSNGTLPTSPLQVGQVISPNTSAEASPSSVPPESSVQPSSIYPSPPTMPTNNPVEPSNTSPSASPLMSASSMQEQQKPGRRFRLPKRVAIVLVALLVLGGGGAAAYFGYYVPNKPPNVWRTALTNSGKAYDKLSQYATSKKDAKGWSAKGAFKLSGDVAADGTFNGQSDSKNGQLSGSVSAVGLKINYDVRAIDSPGNTPDIYFKIDGIQGLGSLVGGFTGLGGEENSQITNALNGLNGQWYFVDHTLFDQVAQSSNTSLQFSSKDVDEVLKAVGDASKQYLFTSDNEKMAVVVKQYVGKEKQDGNSVYHYKVGVNKANLQAYNKALCDNLAKTKLFKLFSSGSANGDVDLIQKCEDGTGLNKVDTTRTADAWVDLHTKLIHKIRFTEKGNANNYTEIAQNYKGGDEFPFSIGFHEQSSVDSGIDQNTKPDTTTGLISMKLNMKTNTFTMDANLEDTGSTKDKGTFNLTVAPSNQTVKVEKPAGAKTIIELVNDLGFGEISGNPSSSSTIQDRAKDTERKTDINALTTQLEVYYADNGSYPTLADLNSISWRAANMPGHDENAFIDPDSTVAKIVATPQAKAYAYQPAPANCKSSDLNSDTKGCLSYTLTATLSDGSKYVKRSLN